MKAAAARFLRDRHRGLSWRSIAWILLVAFTLQSFITQTHIHGTGGAAIVKTFAKVPSHKKLPAENGTADCPLCQAITHAGAFFTPTAPTLLLTVTGTDIVAAFVIANAIDDISTHHWHSRAPPQR
jgi:hypothetical protein